MRLFYRLRIAWKARRHAAREAAVHARWLRERPDHATNGQYADWRRAIGE